MIDSGGVFEISLKGRRGKMDTGLVSGREGNAVPNVEGELRK